MDAWPGAAWAPRRLPERLGRGPREAIQKSGVLAGAAHSDNIGRIRRHHGAVLRPCIPTASRHRGVTRRGAALRPPRHRGPSARSAWRYGTWHYSATVSHYGNADAGKVAPGARGWFRCTRAIRRCVLNTPVKVSLFIACVCVRVCGCVCVRARTCTPRSLRRNSFDTVHLVRKAGLGELVPSNDQTRLSLQTWPTRHPTTLRVCRGVGPPAASRAGSGPCHSADHLYG